MEMEHTECPETSAI